MLGHLAAREGRSQQALSDALSLHRSAVVALVDDLEHRGLAERRRDPRDRRAYQLFLTPRGREVLDLLEQVAEEEEHELMTALDAGERGTFIRLLQRVAASQGLLPGVHPDLDPDDAG
jgi:DNA-binding MarR family transcriptional regulator